MFERNAIIHVVRGPRPLPFVAEYCAFVWLHDDCDSEGDCAGPLDRQWHFLWHEDRRGSDGFEILGPAETERDDGIWIVRASSLEVAERAAYLTALRSDGVLRRRVGDALSDLPLAELAARIPDLAERVRRADEYQTRFLGRRRSRVMRGGRRGGAGARGPRRSTRE